MKLCACGCLEEIQPKPGRGGATRQYVDGHRFTGSAEYKALRRVARRSGPAPKIGRPRTKDVVAAHDAIRLQRVDALDLAPDWSF